MADTRCSACWVDCTLALTRRLASSMDYTPRGFENATREAFVPRRVQPMVLGTRAHQLALFVVFESHLQMVADYPGRYKNEPDFDFIRRLRASWDETRVLIRACRGIGHRSCK